MRNLPAELTSLVGREQEVAELCRLLRERLPHGPRLVTLFGPGGTGKTRLALAAAAALAGDFPGGVHFVPLGALTDPALVEPAVADGLGLENRDGRSIAAVLADYLAGQPALVVLDCFEPVIAAAPLLSELLSAAAELKLLVTSRMLLHLSVEYNFPVSPLAVPAGDLTPEALQGYPAVQLFVMRAAALKPGFAIGSDNAPCVAEICRRLDGLPLALELAAARIRLLSPQALLARLERRLPFLTGGGSDLPERQRTLYRTIDWSYRFLTGQEQQLFNRLAVFAGSWDLPAAEAVIGALVGSLVFDVLDGLMGLADKSLLRQHEGLDGEPRFAMLDTLREYAGEKLAASGEEEAARRSHAAYYAELAEAGETYLRGRDQGAWGRRLAAERDNFREALSWAASGGEAELALRLAAALYPFWERYGNWTEGAGWLQVVLALSGGSARARARALIGAATLTQYQWTNEMGDLRLNWLEESRDLARAAGDRSTEAMALLSSGRMWAERKEFSAGLALMQEALALARASGDRWTTSWILFWIGWDALLAGHTPERTALMTSSFRESLALYESCGDRLGRADALAQLAALEGMQATDQSAYLAAVARLEEAVALFRELDYKIGLVYALTMLGEVVRYHGDHDRAFHAYEQAVEANRAIGLRAGANQANLAAIALVRGDWQQAAGLIDEEWPKGPMSVSGSQQPSMLVTMLMVFSGVFPLRGQPTVGATLLAASQTALQALGMSLQAPDQQVFDWILAATKSQMSEADFAAAWDFGRGLTIEQAYAYGQGQLALPVATAASPSNEAATSTGPAALPGSSKMLSERELEVLRLVAEGLSNREVANRLVLSQWTISAHLRSIYGKLGVGSRTAAARFAMDHGLI
jgi:predicted ATPase/DNA-binding CsgD family transcriptional regulator